jgi:hypothetical protein
VLHNIWVERLVKDKHSSLLGPFVSNENNEVLQIGFLFIISKGILSKAISPINAIELIDFNDVKDYE